MKKKLKSAVETYQCPGCMGGTNTKCYSKSNYSLACGEHRAGTAVSQIGKIFLGMPKGFNRLGVGFGGDENMSIEMFDSFQTKEDAGWEYDMFNIPFWKHVNADGHTLVRGFHPRINRPFLHVILEDCADKIDCYNIDLELIDQMD